VPQNWFGEDVAATYDDDTLDRPADAAADALAALAGPGRGALEFAIGTGRVALPLAARGVRVSGIELSEAMLARLRAKPGGGEGAIPVVVGDMAVARVPGSFDLVYLVFNTIQNLTSQDAQVACFANASRHLRPGGVFVVETGVPGLRRLPPGQRFVLFDAGPAHIGVDEYEPAVQGLVSHHTTVRDGAARQISVPFRYVWPAELDLMARLAGLRLADRWADWSGAPFTSDSESHVSVWERTG
jgi:SAM-dependent methyltransferase